MTDGPDTHKLPWIPELEVEDAVVKWPFSHFGGEEDTFNAKGDHNFTIVFNEEDAMKLREQGWSIREIPGYEEGDPSEFLLKVKISFKFEDPRMFLIKSPPDGGQARKFVCGQDDLRDIKKATCSKLDLVIKPHRWEHGRDSGVSAYVKELYAHVTQSRFAAQYDDMEVI